MDPTGRYQVGGGMVPTQSRRNADIHEGVTRLPGGAGFDPIVVADLSLRISVVAFQYRCGKQRAPLRCEDLLTKAERGQTKRLEEPSLLPLNGPPEHHSDR